MKIPKRFTLGGLVWKVQYKDLTDRNVLGLCWYNKCVIQIQDGLSKQVAYQVYMHELMHAVLNTLSREEASDEVLVDGLAHMLIQVQLSSK